MSRPDEQPSWCDDDNPSKIVEPTSTKKISGFLFAERPPFQYINWLYRNIVKWILHIDESVNHFDCHASATPDAFLNVTSGIIRVGVVTIPKGSQSLDFTGSLPTGAGTSRIDKIVLDNLTGLASIVSGTPAASPTQPATPLGSILLCWVNITETDSVITSSMIINYRPFINNIQLIDEDSMSSDSDKVAPTQQSTKAFVENRVQPINKGGTGQTTAAAALQALKMFAGTISGSGTTWSAPTGGISGWTLSRVSAGIYRINHNFGHTNYSAVVSINVSAFSNQVFIGVTKANNYATVVIEVGDADPSPLDGNYSFMIVDHS